ncbi:Ribosomal_L32p domain-containing protein [Cephalotus follicularis]|uniref:Large ribosomal subunit protein bL32m n=1 Tax=Cephalotus follicularis TaxID=3775 RepID=A0A1Q3C2C6_CEPFO|nr:Ribosomal_L32p domain-containing protein [Cephalotus follicularis]
MAMRLATLKNVSENMVGFRRWVHVMALPPPMDGAIYHATPAPQPEFDDQNMGFSFLGSMELMAVPKKKVSRHKRGIRNGPKALKPIPVIIRCKSCGRVKLPHFYCCSGDRGNTGEQNQ